MSELQDILNKAKSTKLAGQIEQSKADKLSESEKIAKDLGLDSVPAFRVFNFPYAFKTGTKVLKPNKLGIYEVENQADFDYLAWQVKQGRILFN